MGVLREYVGIHTILPLSPVNLWKELDGKPKWLPLDFGYHDVMRTSPIATTCMNRSFRNHGLVLSRIWTLFVHFKLEHPGSQCIYFDLTIFAQNLFLSSSFHFQVLCSIARTPSHTIQWLFLPEFPIVVDDFIRHSLCCLPRFCENHVDLYTSKHLRSEAAPQQEFEASDTRC